VWVVSTSLGSLAHPLSLRQLLSLPSLFVLANSLFPQMVSLGKYGDLHLSFSSPRRAVHSSRKKMTFTSAVLPEARLGRRTTAGKTLLVDRFFSSFSLHSFNDHAKPVLPSPLRSRAAPLQCPAFPSTHNWTRTTSQGPPCLPRLGHQAQGRIPFTTGGHDSCNRTLFVVTPRGHWGNVSREAGP
jgi:hypothetical protein